MQKSKSISFRKRKIKPNADFKFESSNLLIVYMAIDEEKNINKILQETKLEKSVFIECLKQLLKLNLIERVKENIEVVEVSFINRIREILIDETGPMGEILMEEAAKEMNIELNKIPKDQLVDFVYQVTSYIPHGKEALEFKKIMIKEMKKINIIERQHMGI